MAPKRYDFTTILIHWVSALLVIGLFALGLWMVELNYYSSWYRTAPHWHKSIGIIVAAVTALRLIWRLTHLAPPMQGSRLVVFAAKFVHHLLYLLLFTLFISGYLISTADGRPISVFNWFEVPGIGSLFAQQADIAGLIHYYTAWSMILLVALHALAALKHHLIDKDDTLIKMLGVKK
ncbi:cytochrome b [Thaumasiovibrio sp. DFM-14]|uniref:cytochrome b n=1 Tax=Thaumasiovibrio sp. DFM-14 TaxID=3384792 RepID=UPI0039A1891A